MPVPGDLQAGQGWPFSLMASFLPPCLPLADASPGFAVNVHGSLPAAAWADAPLSGAVYLPRILPLVSSRPLGTFPLSPLLEVTCLGPKVLLTFCSIFSGSVPGGRNWARGANQVFVFGTCCPCGCPGRPCDSRQGLPEARPCRKRVAVHAGLSLSVRWALGYRNGWARVGVPDPVVAQGPCCLG